MPSDVSRPNRWWIAPVLGVVVVATAVTALVARNVYHQPPSGSAPPPTVSTTESSVPAGAEPGPAVVAMTPDVAGSAVGKQVQQLLQTYFDAINNRNYENWLSVVTQQRAAQQTQTQFQSGYATTSDGSIRVLRIDTAPTGMSVLLTFHSVQDLAHAPTQARFSCVQWQVVYPLVNQGGTLKLDTGPTLDSPQTQQCA